jgi:WhiB family redox-sensing transcriptional regulator
VYVSVAACGICVYAFVNESLSEEALMNTRPCSADPDLWFGYADDDASDGAAKARVYEQSATRARTICLRRCPLAQQRLCARQAVEAGEEYGVWAGVKLPGGQYRKRHQLAHAHLVLRQIAEGLINPRELPESAELLARNDVAPAAEVAVVHVPLGRRPTAA